MHDDGFIGVICKKLKKKIMFLNLEKPFISFEEVKNTSIWKHGCKNEYISLFIDFCDLF